MPLTQPYPPSGVNTEPAKRDKTWTRVKRDTSASSPRLRHHPLRFPVQFPQRLLRLFMSLGSGAMP